MTLAEAAEAAEAEAQAEAFVAEAAVEPAGAAANADETAAAEERSAGVPRLLFVEQVVGRAGDAVLMHPLLLHSGTTNCAFAPRLLANGVARVRVASGDTGDAGAGVGADAGEDAGYCCPLLARDVARLGLDNGP
jgi:hypothetical protein